MVSFKTVQQSWVLSLGWLSAAWALCPPTGPVLPPPVLSSDTLDLSSLKATLEGFESNSSNSEWVTNKTFFSVSVTTSKSTVFSFFKTPPVYNSSGTHEANGSSVQRVASVTKVFTTLAVLLQDSMRLSDPISAYVPELSAERWQHVTLAMLAGQHAGIARDGEAPHETGLRGMNRKADGSVDPVFDMAITDPLPFTKMGFPSLNGSELPKCSGDASQPPCSRSGTLKRCQSQVTFS
jgi:CubicO group peptidase (beta-lactamase class C family)